MQTIRRESEQLLLCCLPVKGRRSFWYIKKIARAFDKSKIDCNGADRYYAANAGNADEVERKLKEINADYLVKESDISDENAVKEIYSAAIERFGKVDILVNNAADCDCAGFDTIEKITHHFCIYASQTDWLFCFLPTIYPQKLPGGVSCGYGIENGV